MTSTSATMQRKGKTAWQVRVRINLADTVLLNQSARRGDGGD